MLCSIICYNPSAAFQSSPLIFQTLENDDCHRFPSTFSSFLCTTSPFKKNPLLPLRSSSSSPPSFTAFCFREKNGDYDEGPLSASTAYEVLGVKPNCSSAELKSAFRAKVKQFHPDVRNNGASSDFLIRRVIQAYEILSNYSRTEIIERECLDPFDEPESEAFDIFVDETSCIGKGCPYSCVKRAPHAFSFSSSTGSARAFSQGHGEDGQVQLAVGQCPRNCIHYVTPLQRVILEELLDGIMNVPYDTSPEADLLYALIMKARFENNRYQKPKRISKVSTDKVDWF